MLWHSAFFLKHEWVRKCFRFMLQVLTALFYRLRVHGLENVPREGGALLVSNHISWLDGPLLMMVNLRPVRMIVYEGNFRNPLMRWWALLWGTILVDKGPKSIIRALRAAGEAIEQGDLVGIFPEGGISRNGMLNGFRPGLVRIVKERDVPVIPVCIDELWGSIFSFSRGRFFTKLPSHYRQPISVYFGKPLKNVTDVYQVRRAVQDLGVGAVNTRQKKYMSLPRTFVRRCKRRLFTSKIADSSGMDLTGGQCLLRTLIVRRLLKRHVLRDGEQKVGILLPPSVGGVLANMALTLAGRTCVNLNYTVSSDVLNYCIAEAGIKHVLTSRQVMSKMNFELDAELIYLEDFKDKVQLGDKIASALSTYALPAFALSWLLGLYRIKGSDVATVIFTSGSTGTPKGVVLSYDNIAHNVTAVQKAVHLNRHDVVLGILPFFHSFGYAITLWTPMALDIKSVYHYTPLDGKRIGKLAQQHAATVLLATPTFLRNYVKRCAPEQFATLDVVVAGAEKLPSSLCDAFEEKFGIRPVEGYGCTELAPLAAVNIPPSRSHGEILPDAKEGTVGRPVADVAAKIANLETGEELGPDQEGMLLVTGPNVMQGYLNQPEKTKEVLRDGWYVTGDVALIDSDGFIKITGRESRFSKIGGEMVPHVRIEEALTQLLERDEEERIKAVVTAVPDEKKGERLVVLHLSIDKTPGELCAGLKSLGLPNLFIPSEDSFFEVDELPVLGTGKLDLSTVKVIAAEKVGIVSAS